MNNSPEPTFDRSELRKCLGLYPTGVVVVTTRSMELHWGMAVNSFTSLSLDPPLILWSIRNNSTSFDAFTRCDHFAVNILASDQAEHAGRFAKSGPDKFDGAKYRSGLGNAPVLDDVVASLECERISNSLVGDHTMIIGLVKSISHSEKEPLVFKSGGFTKLASMGELCRQ